MPATRSRASTEQTAEVAAEEVKQVQEEVKEFVDTPAQDAVPEGVVEPVEAPVVPETPVVVPETPVEETNGTSEVVPDVVANGTNGTVETNGVVEPEVPVVEGESVEKRKSVNEVGEGDAPDTTEVVAKKQKVDEEAVAVAEDPVVEASV